MNMMVEKKFIFIIKHLIIMILHKNRGKINDVNFLLIPMTCFITCSSLIKFDDEKFFCLEIDFHYDLRILRLIS